MFILVAPLHRNGANSKEYFNPDVTGPIPSCVIASLTGDNRHEAKQYATEEEARADIPVWIDLRIADMKACCAREESIAHYRENAPTIIRVEAV
jgi:hypothetical protein